MWAWSIYLQGDDIVAVEWADRIPGLFPNDYLEIAFAYLDENRRQICLTAHGARYAALLAQLAAGDEASNRRSVK